MPSFPKWYDGTGTTELTTEQALTASAGIASTPLEVQVINNKDLTGATPLENARLRALFRDQGETDFEGAGDEWPDRFFIEIKQETGGHNTTFAAGAYVSVGANRTFQLPTLGNDEGVKLSVRVNAPPDAQGIVKEFTLVIEQAFGQATSVGVVESGHPGVVLKLRDRAFSGLARIGGDAVENPGGADQDVQTTDAVWTGRGVVFAHLAALINHPLSTATFSRYDLVYLADDGTATRLAGTETTAALTEDDKPAVPVGGVAYYYVVVDDTGPITDAEIENVWERSYFGFVSDGLVVRLGGGVMLSDNSLVTHSLGQNLTLDASDDNYVFMLRDGSLAIANDLDIDSLPADRAMLLWKFTTDATDVTASEDLRQFTGARLHVLRFEWVGEGGGTDWAIGDYRYAMLEARREAQVLPLHAIVASLGEQVVGSGLSGETRWDVEVERSGTFESLFTVDAHYPQIAFDATDLRDLAVFPETFDVPANARVRAKVVELPTGTVTTDPKDLTLTLVCGSAGGIG